MNATEIVEKAQQSFARVNRMPVAGVVGLTRRANGSSTEDGWVVSLEAVERRAIPETMDVLGLYEVYVDSRGNLRSFERKGLRKRGDTEE
jgi:hypothetical protein